MVKYYPSITDDHRDWALRQQVFFIASAPLSGTHINLSPKGLPSTTLSVLDPNHVCYMDATGSGIETVSHVHENGRATLMFCSFDRAPRIMRWFCRGRVIEWDQPEFDVMLDRMKKNRIDGARAILAFEVFKVQTSCGFAVPLLSTRLNPSDPQSTPQAYLHDRSTLGHFAKKTVQKEGLMEWYQSQANVRSLDGLGGLRAARKGRGENLLLQDGLIWVRRVAGQWDAVLVGAVGAVLLLVALRAVGRLVGVGWGW